jgi:hypothetical protein
MSACEFGLFSLQKNLSVKSALVFVKVHFLRKFISQQKSSSIEVVFVIHPVQAIYSVSLAN